MAILRPFSLGIQVQSAADPPRTAATASTEAALADYDPARANWVRL